MKLKYTDGYFNVSKKHGFLPMYTCLNDTINIKYRIYQLLNINHKINHKDLLNQ